MKVTKLDSQVSVSDQITAQDIAALKVSGVQVIVCNRPDKESADQLSIADVRVIAAEQGIEFYAIAFAPNKITDNDTQRFLELLSSNKTLHAYCRSGARSTQLYRVAQEALQSNKDFTVDGSKFDVVIVGAGSAGIATAASLHKRNKKIRIALIDPSETHYYQPGWTLVGGGVLTAESTKRRTKDIIPKNCTWIKRSVSGFTPKQNRVELSCGASVYYQQLVVAPGLKLDWSAIEGLEDTLGKNGVTSNYRYDLAPYTWELVQNLKSGKAVFTQPPMPIKCAGAPQKAMYLSASEWFKKGMLDDVDIEFYNSGGVLFGVEAYVPALMEYVKKYNAKLRFSKTLVKVDGEHQKAWFTDSKGSIEEVDFDFLHVVPPQVAPDFIRNSVLSDDAGWLDVDSGTLQSKGFPNVWGVGDVLNTTNAKTMAAARKQAPVVAHNIAAVFAHQSNFAHYDGYGSCPLTVEHGKIVLAEFTYGGTLAPSFPAWFNDGTQATGFAWFLKARMLPPLYWRGMLKGREWLASPAY